MYVIKVLEKVRRFKRTSYLRVLNIMGNVLFLGCQGQVFKYKPTPKVSPPLLITREPNLFRNDVCRTQNLRGMPAKIITFLTLLRPIC